MAGPASPKGTQRQARRPRGLTALEVMVMVAMMIILAAIAIPNVSPVILRHRLRGAAWQLAGDLRLARQRAVTLRKRFRVCVRSCAIAVPAGTYSLEQYDGTRWISETSAATKLPADVSISASATALFYPTGTAVPTATYTLTNLLGQYQVTVASTGRVQVCEGAC